MTFKLKDVDWSKVLCKSKQPISEVRAEAEKITERVKRNAKKRTNGKKT
jgi:hypothetical protein